MFQIESSFYNRCTMWRLFSICFDIWTSFPVLIYFYSFFTVLDFLFSRINWPLKVSAAAEQNMKQQKINRRQTFFLFC